MIIPEKKPKILEGPRSEVAKVQKRLRGRQPDRRERYQNVISIWTQATDEVTKDMMEELKKDQEGFNPVYIMQFSGARGNKDQIRQLCGMRGLMQRPTKKLTGSIGEIIESPIMSNFREGLTVLEYFISTHGARKGLADTALKTSDAGYLTRRLRRGPGPDHHRGGLRHARRHRSRADHRRRPRGERILEPLRDRITGRVRSRRLKKARARSSCAAAS
jgi:DNA-directed RNA polymerase subunit beta'